MNKRTKVKILKSALASITIEFNSTSYSLVNRRGLCFHLCKACNEILGKDNHDISYYEITSFFGINKPKNSGNFYWFPLNEKGFNKRVALLNKAIKKLSSPTKKKS